MTSTFYELSDKDMDGKSVPMSSFEGKIVLLVNVASECGRTKSNYTQIPKLMDEYPMLKVLAFPWNQFGGQEPVEYYNYRMFVPNTLLLVMWLPVYYLFGCHKTVTSTPFLNFNSQQKIYLFIYAFCHIHIQGTHEDICEYVGKTYNGVNERFQFFEKANVNGDNARDVYKFVKSQLGVANVSWNFDLFLINQKGEPFKYIRSSNEPYDAVKKELDILLA